MNPFASCLPLVLQLPVFIALYVAIAGRAVYLNKAAVVALQNASFLWIHKLGKPDPTYVLLVLYVVTQLVSTELMLTAQTDKQQKYLMRAMPILFVLFLFRFPAGLFVYWVTTNLWSIGQQLLIRRTMKPKDLTTMAAQPPRKRGRFMEAILSAQQQQQQQQQQPRSREDEILEKRRQKAAELAAGKQGDAKKIGTGQGGRQQDGQDGGQQAAKQGGTQTKKGVRKPPPGKGKHKPGPSAGQGKSKSGSAGG